MPKARKEQKAEQVDVLTEKLKKAKVAVLTDYRGHGDFRLFQFLGQNVDLLGLLFLSGSWQIRNPPRPTTTRQEGSTSFTGCLCRKLSGRSARTCGLGQNRDYTEFAFSQSSRRTSVRT